jgi:hypothetical protein
MPLFGCRTWNESEDERPAMSPHGNQRAVIAAETILQSTDFLFPLTTRLQSSQSSPGNWYATFLLIKTSSISTLQTAVNLDWIKQYMIVNHPYFRLEGGSLRYASFIDEKKVWCKILVPHEVKFDATTTRWESMEDLNSWTGVGRHDVFESRTGQIAKELGVLKWKPHPTPMLSYDDEEENEYGSCEEEEEYDSFEEEDWTWSSKYM